MTKKELRTNSVPNLIVFLNVAFFSMLRVFIVSLYQAEQRRNRFDIGWGRGPVIQKRLRFFKKREWRVITKAWRHAHQHVLLWRENLGHDLSYPSVGEWAKRWKRRSGTLDLAWSLWERPPKPNSASGSIKIFLTSDTKPASQNHAKFSTEPFANRLAGWWKKNTIITWHSEKTEWILHLWLEREPIQTALHCCRRQDVLAANPSYPWLSHDVSQGRHGKSEWEHFALSSLSKNCWNNLIWITAVGVLLIVAVLPLGLAISGSCCPEEAQPLTTASLKTSLRPTHPSVQTAPSFLLGVTVTMMTA